MSPRLSWVIEELPEQGVELRVDASDERFRKVLDAAKEGGLRDAFGSAELSVQPWPERVDIDGRIRAKLPMSCARCLTDFVEPIDRTFRQILVRVGDRGDEGADVELDAVDLDRSELVGDRLDLLSVLHEELQLAIPAKALCSPDCKGICAGCGAELNQEPCTCAPEVDERFAPLLALKAKLGG